MMGACLSLSTPPAFIVSVAPTSRATCRACRLGINRGELTVSRIIAARHFLTGASTSEVTSHHYHFEHGMRAATMVPCDKGSQPPSFKCVIHLTALQERKALNASRHALEVWQARRGQLRATKLATTGLCGTWPY